MNHRIWFGKKSKREKKKRAIQWLPPCGIPKKDALSCFSKREKMNPKNVELLK